MSKANEGVDDVSYSVSFNVSVKDLTMIFELAKDNFVSNSRRRGEDPFDFNTRCYLEALSTWSGGAVTFEFDKALPILPDDEP